ncbi:hypothetical protein PUNSTDRAFT_68488 [Punctularia strigosozonata HHB-11173 SS5]|uniref:uncharacterized protein n=1 Tax=Punctularia strigosozonata (strain HHB-11173) TaxID=741275 RepID=UPI0004416EDC|nr:uncharacterized protein PUNSTDRAFT_68488 [Punctularia strigosozonata HHB-11173 SS5]EIN08377.1 hypothetical protein PUNSTDRAFT_68488 [Punctularia strigosozonata HHB-11173 SS5]
MAKATVIQAWKFTGVPACDSEEDAVSPAHLSMPPEQAFPHLFYGMLLTGQRPGPGLEIYISLGFCTCRDQGEEHGLANTYRLLIDKCTFPEFCDAFASQSLGQLLETHDLTSHLPRHFASATALSKPSVWYLKDFVLQDNLVLDNESDLVKSLQNSVRVDYGFWNAKNLEEIQVLRSAYRQYFDAYGDAVELHNACIQGRIYEHVNSVVRLKSKWLKRLMMNIYPLSSSD